MRSRLLSGVAAALLLAAAAPASADRETAEFFAKRGEKAAKEKSWPAAEDAWRRSLEEDATFLPARLGLAEALVGAGKVAEAVVELRTLVEATEAPPSPLPAAWADVPAKARRRLAELDAGGAALSRIQGKYAEDLVALASKWMKSDAALAERSLRRALTVQPGHAKATSLLAKMGLSDDSRTKVVWNGADFDGWASARPPIWTVVQGEIVGESSDGAYGTRTHEAFEGDFDVRMEARLLVSKTESAFWLLGGARGDEEQWQVGVFEDRVQFDEQKGPGASKRRRIADVLARTLKPPVDVKAWNRFELRFRGAEITAYVNGQAIGRSDRPKDVRGGAVGLIIQDAKAAYRRIEVIPR